MSSSQEVTLIVDNSSASFPNGWQVIEDPVFYGGTAAFFNGSQGIESSDMNMSFHGTSISFYGIVSGGMVTLDRNNPMPVSSAELVPVWNVWYQSSPLPDEEHNILVENSLYMYIDYALIKAGSTTNLSGKTIFVDNAKQDEIWYTGQWLASVDDIFVHSLPNSTSSLTLWRNADRTQSRSNTTEDSFEFRFSGTSISVYGILPWPHNFTVDFIMDGSVQRENYPQKDSDKSINTINYKFYENTVIGPGNHTLIVKVTNVLDGSRFIFDYITYTPSFSFIHEKPTFIRGSPDSQGPQTSSALPTAVIVGIVIACLSIVVLVGVFHHFWRKRSVSRKEVTVASIIEPFATHFAGDTKPKRTKWRGMFPSGDTGNSTDSIDERRVHLEPLWIPRNTVEIRQRNDEIASLTAQLEHSDNPTRGELFARINMLTIELERVVRENAPPEYGGSDVDQRPSSRSGTLPSYDLRDGA